MKTTLSQLLRDSAGATAIEYGLLVGLIALAIFGAVSSVAAANQSGWNQVLTKVNEATGISTSA